MSTAETIASARRHLVTGNPGAYARVMSAAIRAAKSDRTDRILRATIKLDGSERLFRDLDTSAPIAA